MVADQVGPARDRIRIPVDPPDKTIGGGKQRTRVAAAAEGAVDINRPGPGLEEV
jgi:hypothetical protein